MPAQQGVDADREHRAHDFRRERLADADRVGDDEVVLQLFQQAARALLRIAAGQLVARAMCAQQAVGIAAEAGGHTVDRLAAPGLLGKEIRGALHAGERCGIERDVRAGLGGGHELGPGEVLAVEQQGRHRLHRRSLPHAAPFGTVRT